MASAAEASAVAWAVAGQFDDADPPQQLQLQQPTIDVRVVCVWLGSIDSDGLPVVCNAIQGCTYDVDPVGRSTNIHTHIHPQPVLPSPPTDQDELEEEDWDEDEDEEDEELDEDAYAALEGLLLGEAGGKFVCLCVCCVVVWVNSWVTDWKGDLDTPSASHTRIPRPNPITKRRARRRRGRRGRRRLLIFGGPGPGEPPRGQFEPERAQ